MTATDVSTPARGRRRLMLALVAVVAATGLVTAGAAALVPESPQRVSKQVVTTTPSSPSPSPPFDPDDNAILPQRRVVAFYAIPGAQPAGPAWKVDEQVLARLRAQGAEYERLDPAHPVALGIDLVASVPDRVPGPSGTYSHHLDPATLDRYVEFCRTNGLLLFLDLNIGWASPMAEFEFVRPYLTLPFVHLAVDPEWMFPRHDGIPGVHLSNVRAADLNPLITALAEIPVRHRVPRKIMILHQYRPDGDDLADPYDRGAAEIADKRNLVADPRVDTVVHVDSVGGWPGDIELKTSQYTDWVSRDMARFGNFRYGGFKIFYQLESRNRLMTPAEVLALQPAPMVVTYGN